MHNWHKATQVYCLFVLLFACVLHFIEFGCTRPTNPSNGVVLPLNKRRFSNSKSVTYRCNRGFRLNGKSQVTCNNNKWSHEPMCRRKYSAYGCFKLLYFEKNLHKFDCFKHIRIEVNSQKITSFQQSKDIMKR